MDKKHSEILRAVKDFTRKINIDVEKGEVVGELSERLDDSYLILRFPNNMGISGVSFVKKDVGKEYKCIYVNNKEPVGRQNFTLAHEIYHIFYEESTKGLCMVDERYTDKVELNAERFASNLLIPKLLLLSDLKRMGYNSKKKLEEDDVFQLQNKYKVTFQAIIYAIDNLKQISIYEEFFKYIPIVPDKYKRYFKAGWDDLETRTSEYNQNLKLNASNPKYIIPDKFKENLIRNYKRKLIDYLELEDIFYFFEIEDELDNV